MILSSTENQIAMNKEEQKINNVVAKFRDSESYKKKIARAKESLSKARFPKGLFEQFGLPRPKFGQEIEVAM